VDISPATAIAMKQQVVEATLATGVLRKTLDITAQEGEALVKMLQQSSGVGGRVDLYA
jgi:hypothetical protein